MTVLTNLANGGSGKDFRDTLNDMLARLLPTAVASAMRDQGLDITPLEPVALAALTSPTVYTDYIAMIRALLVGTTAVETNLGNASDNATPVYSWTVGAGRKTILLTAGMHSGENHGQLAVIRVFEWIAKRATPLARRIFASYKVIMVPNVNPTGFTAANGGRTNANGVNINRQGAYFWAAYDETQGTDNAKGTSAFGEKEAQYIKAIFDANDVRVYVDNHNMGTTGATTDLVIEPPSAAIYANRQAVLGAMAQFRAATGATVATLSNGASFEPTIMNWASYYMGVLKGNSDAVTALIECLSNAKGSTDRAATADLMTMYGTGIISLIRAHMEGNGRADQRLPVTLYQRRDNNDSATSIAQGGTLIDQTVATALQYDAMQSVTIASGTKRPYRDFILPGAGVVFHFVQMDLVSSGSAEQVDLALSWNGVVSGLYANSFILPATNNAVTTVNLLWMTHQATAPDAVRIDRFAVTAKKAAAGTTNPRFTKFRHFMQFFPYNPLETLGAQSIVPQPVVT
ncbi:MAG: M14 family metallopeptidase [Sphingomonas phyllosphaerae]|uniref:M14 family metallopeptidase n=1 Tax=Sphingomonas phyllosphaerae TaxID=257003 RepID=UPI002FFC832D